MSRGPLREAIQRLVQEGIVTSIPNRGTFVKELDDGAVVDLYVARFGCEAAAVRLLMSQPRSAHIDRLREMVDDLSRALEESNWEEAGELDLAFHEELVRAASNPHLDRMFDTLRVETMLCLARMESAYPEEAELANEHLDLLEAIESGDVNEAIAALREHMAAGSSRLSGATFPL